ncbi:GGDEF domain-containing protein [Acetobacterium tundrae]|nr:diguanylate cyclase [Acetobacterium tundrae]
MKQFKPYKLLQTVIMIFFTIVCFILALYLSHLDAPLSSSIYLTLLLICILVVFIINFVCILYDLSVFQKMSLDYFDVNKIAYLDQLTGKANRCSFDLLLKDFAAAEEIPNIGCLAFSLINLPSINKTKGYEHGDLIIRDFSEMLNDLSESYGIFGRNSGNEFIVVIRQCDHVKIEEFIKELDIQIEVHNFLLEYQGINYHYGCVLNAEENFDAISQIISLSIQRMLKKNDL